MFLHCYLLQPFCLSVAFFCNRKSHFAVRDDPAIHANVGDSVDSAKPRITAKSLVKPGFLFKSLILMGSGSFLKSSRSNVATPTSKIHGEKLQLSTNYSTTTAAIKIILTYFCGKLVERMHYKHCWHDSHLSLLFISLVCWRIN